MKERNEKFKKAGKQASMRNEYRLVITPAIVPEQRHKIEKVLSDMGYNVWAGGTNTDMSSCDIAFNRDLK